MFFPNVSFEPPQEFKIGFATDFEVGKVDLRFKKDYNVWVVRDKNLYMLYQQFVLTWVVHQTG